MFPRATLILLGGFLKPEEQHLSPTVFPELMFEARAVGRLSVSDLSLKLHLFLTILAFKVNAASKGHLPIVLYLLTKQSANPLIRNNWGETAYDVAAAVFEVWICEVRDASLNYLRRFTLTVI